MADSKTLALTMGDPASIAPEITNAALINLEPWFETNQITVKYFGDPALLSAPVTNLAFLEAVGPTCAELSVLGQPSAANAQAVIDSISQATAACLDGQCAAMVTNPISKAVLYNVGFSHPGHTEFLAALCDCPKPTVMMLTSDQLSVIPITLHTSVFQAVSDIRTNGTALIHHALRVAVDTLKAQGITRPRLAVSGLNPHAGEQGAMGLEEIEIIAPALESFKPSSTVSVLGPLPADTMFDEFNRQKYDIALAMTHDQALIPIKTLAFDSAVNVTLGLPIVRTSPDHGTAFDIAGKGVARSSSLEAAIKKAATMAGLAP